MTAWLLALAGLGLGLLGLGLGLGVVIAMTIPGAGGQVPPRADQQPMGAQPVPVSPGSSAVVRARQVIIASPGEDVLVYSPSAGAGNLLFSINNGVLPLVDEFGNITVPLTGWYDNSGGFFTQIGAGFVTFGTGSLSAGWTANATIQNDASGNLNLSATGNLTFNGTPITVP